MRRRVTDLAVIVLLVAYVMASVTLLWERPYVLAALLLVPSIVLGIRVGDLRRALALAATGLVLGPLTESLSILGGLWTYADTGGLPLVPPWNYPLWTCFPAALWIIVRSVLGEEGSPRSSALHLALVLAGLGLEIVLFTTLGHSSLYTLAAVVPLTAVLLGLVRRRAAGIIFVAGGLIGPVCESLPIAAGAWVYALPEMLGMPVWLPFGYALFAVFLSLAAEQVAALVASPLPEVRRSMCRD